MKIPFLHKPTVKEITGDAYGPDRYEATTVLTKLLREFPELVAATVVEVKSARTLAAYTSLVTFDPYKLSTREAELIKQVHKILTAHWLHGQELQDIVVVLDEQLHILRPMANGKWLCSLVVRSTDTNLALLRDAVRRHAR